MKPRFHRINARVAALFVLFAVYTLLPMTVAGQVFPRREFLDVIRVDDGSVLKGRIIERVPDRYVIIQLYGGSSFVLGYETIRSIEREKNPDYSLAWVKTRTVAPEHTGARGLIEGGHIIGMYTAGGYSWFGGADWDELTDQLSGVDETSIEFFEFGLSWRWLRPHSQNGESRWMWGTRGGLGYTIRDGAFIADDPSVDGGDYEYSIATDIVRIPLEFLFGVGGDRFALLVGAGPGIAVNMRAPNYEISSASLDESDEFEEKSDLSLIYSASLGFLVRVGRAWVVDTTFFTDGQLTATTKEQLYYRAWGLSVGIGYRFGG